MTAHTLKRFEDRNGLRYYGTPVGAFPSVTTILSATDDPRSKTRLREIVEEKPELQIEWDWKRERGNCVHEVISQWIRLGDCDPDKWDEDQYPKTIGWKSRHELRSMQDYTNYRGRLDKFGAFPLLVDARRTVITNVKRPIWSEGPIGEHEQFGYLVGEDGHPRVWSKKYGYAGCPDLRCAFGANERMAQDTIVDIKTSEVLYRRYRAPWSLKDEAARKKHNNGFYKWEKVKLQLVAYDLAFQETMGLEPAQELLALVISTEGTQVLRMTSEERDQAQETWLKKVEQFYEQQNQQDENRNE